MILLDSTDLEFHLVLKSPTLNYSFSPSQSRKFTDTPFNILLCIYRNKILAKFLSEYLKL